MKKLRILISVLSCILFIGVFSHTEVKAAWSYVDPYTFFRTCTNPNTHAEFADGHIYYATMGKTASSSGVLRFRTIGFQITASGNGASMSIDVMRNGAYLQDVAGDCSYQDGYTYNLYKISYQTIAAIMNARDPYTWGVISNANLVKFRMDAIMTTVSPGSIYPNSYVVAESMGTLAFSNPSATYYVGTGEGLAAMEGIFGWGKFTYYRDISSYLGNNTLTVQFASGADNVTSSKGYKIGDGQIILKSNGSLYQLSGKRFGSINLPHPVNYFGLQKTGYKIKAGAEWRLWDSTQKFPATNVYTSLLNNAIAQGNCTQTLYANWEPIKYYIKYAAGEKGQGNGKTQTLRYDKYAIVSDNMYYSDTHDFIGWNTKADGSGTWYQPNDDLLNLTTKDGEVIVFYAQWKPKVFEITVFGNGGSGGTENFYEVYETCFTLESEPEHPNYKYIHHITPPGNKKGYSFIGAYASMHNKNEQIVDASGKILIEPTQYKKNVTIFAWWEPNEYKITFEQQGGTGGTEKALIKYDSYNTYNEDGPLNLEAPYKEGYSFKGYYTEKYGKGECFYNEYMAPTGLYQTDSDITLFAYWVDDIHPNGRLNIPDTWANDKGGIPITGWASDYGSGLQKVEIYLEAPGGDQLVKSYKNLNGAKELTIDGITHTMEGAYVYRMEIWDQDMNVTETSVKVYKNAKYDITAPTGRINGNSSFKSLYDIYLEIYVTDYKLSN